MSCVFFGFYLPLPRLNDEFLDESLSEDGQIFLFYNSFFVLMRVSWFILIFCCFVFAKVYGQRPCYQGYVDAGFSAGTTTDSYDRFIFRTSHGVKIFHDRLFAGGGVGWGMAVHHKDIPEYDLPVFGDLRYTFNKKKVSPFADMKIGYAVMWNAKRDYIEDDIDIDGGFFCEPSAGLAIRIGAGYGLDIALGYTIERARWKMRMYNNECSVDRLDIEGLNLSIGFSF